MRLHRELLEHVEEAREDVGEDAQQLMARLQELSEQIVVARVQLTQQLLQDVSGRALVGRDMRPQRVPFELLGGSVLHAIGAQLLQVADEEAHRPMRIDRWVGRLNLVGPQREVREQPVADLILVGRHLRHCAALLVTSPTLSVSTVAQRA